MSKWKLSSCFLCDVITSSLSSCAEFNKVRLKQVTHLPQTKCVNMCVYACVCGDVLLIWVWVSVAVATQHSSGVCYGRKKAVKYDSDERDLDNLFFIWVTAESCRCLLSTNSQNHWNTTETQHTHTVRELSCCAGSRVVRAHGTNAVDAGSNPPEDLYSMLQPHRSPLSDLSTDKCVYASKKKP